MESTTLTDLLKVEGINCKGFGIIPKFVMLDQDLSLEAKAIYAYFSSYAGAGNTAFPSRGKILADLCVSKNAYYRHYNQLIDQGYIQIQSMQNDNSSQYTRNIYTLVSNPRIQLGKLSFCH